MGSRLVKGGLDDIGEMFDKFGISADDTPTPVPNTQDLVQVPVPKDRTPAPVPGDAVPEPVGESFPDAQPRFVASQTGDSLLQEQASGAEPDAPSVAGVHGDVAESLKRLRG